MLIQRQMQLYKQQQCEKKTTTTTTKMTLKGPEINRSQQH